MRHFGRPIAMDKSWHLADRFELDVGCTILDHPAEAVGETRSAARLAFLIAVFAAVGSKSEFIPRFSPLSTTLATLFCGDAANTIREQIASAKL